MAAIESQEETQLRDDFYDVSSHLFGIEVARQPLLTSRLPVSFVQITSQSTQQ
jgi:hypothetical protein